MQLRYSVLALPIVTCLVSLTILFAVPGEAGSAIAFGLIAVMTVAAVVVGIRRYRPRAATVWFGPLLGLAFFCVGNAIRGWQGYADLSGSVVPDIFTILAYVAITTSVIEMFRPHGDWDLDAYLDVAVVICSSLLASWTLIAEPALRATPGAGLKPTLMALYPMVDTVQATLVVYCAVTRDRQGISLRLVEAALCISIAANLTISLDATGITHLGDNALVAPYLVGAALYAVGALHPSMREVTSPHAEFDRSRQRSLVLGIGLFAAAWVPVLGFGRQLPADRWVIGPLLSLMLACILVRGERSIGRYKRREAHARNRAERDQLTQLYNRTTWLDLAAPMTAGTTSVIFIDLDGFKLVNDIYGHDAGDELLIEAAARLRASVRGQDIVARYGGDEFVIAGAADRFEAATIATRIFDHLSAPFRLTSAGVVQISASIGIATSDSGAAPDDLLRRADCAMYHVKAAGKSGIAHYEASGGTPGIARFD